MARGFSGSLPGSSLQPSSGPTIYVALLVTSKFLKAVGLFMAYDLLKLIPVVVFLYLLKAGTSFPLLFLQKPFSLGPKLTKNQWFRIWRHALFGTGIGFLWLFGLTQCGPLRTILLFEHSDFIILAGANALFSSQSGGPSKARGAFVFLVAVISLLLFDHDEKLSHQLNDGERLHHTIFSHFFKHGIDFLGWSDHKGGVVLLFITLCLHSGYNSAAKKLSVEVGGAKRLHALSTLTSAGILWPWAVFIFFTTESEVQSWLYVIFPLFLVVLFVGVLDFYIESVAANHIQSGRAALLASIAIFVSAVFLSVTWTHPYITHVTTMHKLNDVLTEDHVLSGGVIFSVMAFLLGSMTQFQHGWIADATATRILVSKSKAAKGSFIGYSTSGLPLYSISSEDLRKTSQSVMSVLKGGLRQILEDMDSRKIFYFLCINLAFTFVELLYGVWTNSLGLISDGFHMLFDCSALVMGLYAAIMVRWKATRVFSYGYDRVEVLSGFINGLFLVVIAIFVFTEAMARLFEPPEVKTEKLLTVSVIGLIVNLIGIFAFQNSLSHAHSHGGGHGHSHGGGHGHSHGGHSHSSSVSDGGQASGHGHHNTNMEGVFLHVVADTLGSVGVIISTLLIENLGWNIADPICSLFIASMIFLSVIPLLKETAIILLLHSPFDLEHQVEVALDKIRGIDGVMSYREPHFWSHTANKSHGMIHLQVMPQVQEQRIIAQASSIFKEAGITNMTIQVEKQSYFFHMSGLGAAPVNISQFALPPPQPHDEGPSIKAV